MTVRTFVNIALMLLLATPALGQKIQSTKRPVAVCDWMILKRQKLGEFALARSLGADGVELDMGSLGKRELFDNQLRDSLQARKFRHYADSLHIQVPSVAMSGFFAQSLIKRSSTNVRNLMNDCISTMRIFHSKVVFLPLGGSGRGWMQAGAERDTLVSRLRMIGRMAEKAGVVVGLRTALDAKGDIRLLKEIGSDAVKIYYNFQDAADNNRDICKELKKLGRKRIVQIHATNTDGVLLRDDAEIDMTKIRKTLDKMKWNGWLVVERSRDANRVRDVKYNYGNNVSYLKEIFAE